MTTPNRKMTKMISFLLLHFLWVPAFASIITQDCSQNRSNSGFERCPNQTEIEFRTHRLIERAEKFEHAVNLSPGFEEVLPESRRLVKASREFAFNIERSLECHNVRIEFIEVEESFNRLNQHFLKLLKHGYTADLYLREEYDLMNRSYDRLRFEVQEAH